ncbi:MAG: glycosyltransferase family 39 protein [Pseudomonadota bacterium]
MNRRVVWTALLLMAMSVRLLTLGSYPLHDKTEARYAEIARVMVESNNWVTPQVFPDTPFWGKPPLSTWSTALSLWLFGASEFAARLPSFLWCAFAIGLILLAGGQCFTQASGFAAAAVFLTSLLGFIGAGATMTDPALLFSVTLSQMSFCMVITAHRPKTRYRYGLFVGVGLGLLAKGPIALVLIGLPLLIWVIWERRFVWLWKTLPWVRGTTLAMAIAVPWYVAAEIRTPGFLNYFLIGEHVLRFVDSGWSGDLYGSAHEQARGTIWLYAIAATLPWSLIACVALVSARHTAFSPSQWSALEKFLMLCLSAPLLFFTFAGNILPTYVLPGIPAFSLLIGRWVVNRSSGLGVIGLLVPSLIGISVLSGFFASADNRSQRDLIDYHAAHHLDKPLYYYPVIPMSARFYSEGSAIALDSESALAHFVANPQNGWVAIKSKNLQHVPVDMSSCLVLEAVIHKYSIMAPSDVCRQKSAASE